MKEKLPQTLKDLREKWSRMDFDKENKRVVDNVFKDFELIVKAKIKNRRENQKAILQPEDFDRLESQVQILKSLLGEDFE